MTEEKKLANLIRHTLSSVAQLYAPDGDGVSLVEEDGVRYLHFGTPWVQGAMRLDDPYGIEIEYLQQMMMWMLFKPQPAHIVQLGLGAASLSKFCWRRFPDAKITTVELQQAVIDICRNAFELPANNDRLNVVAMDAMDFVLDTANHGTVDILQVDLYDAHARGPVLSSAEFYRACAQCLTPDGIITVNLFCDYPEHHHHLGLMDQAFHAVAWLPEVHDSNIVAIGFKHASAIDFSDLSKQADLIREQTGLPAQTWVDGLQDWMQEHSA
ncbi:MAG: spermidine synthase [Burkholderiaceae bacterium]|nr:spermidine synthase [Burkholderiaceae bacterium]